MQHSEMRNWLMQPKLCSRPIRALVNLLRAAWAPMRLCEGAQCVGKQAHREINACAGSQELAFSKTLESKLWSQKRAVRLLW